ncbi:MAG TPA: porin [Gammaproteobacteria bacterium]|nr:porin [Gammaproteobacteria bacterium]
MNKKLIAIAVGAALAAPMAAQADVSIYGRAQVELHNTKFDDGTNSYTSRGLIDNKMGRLGVNASEDLGNGLTGLAHFGFIVDTSPVTGGGGIGTSRQAYVGFSGGFGTVRFGRMAGSYKGTNLDPFIATTLEARSFGGESRGNFGHNGFINDAIKYDNKFGQVKISALVTAGNSNSQGYQKGDNGDFQLAADYKGGPLRVILAYSKNKDASLGTSGLVAEKRTKLAAQYQIGPGKATLSYESVKDYSTDNLGGLVLDAFGVATPDPAVSMGDVRFLMASYDMNLGSGNSLYLRYGNEKYKDMGDMKSKSYAIAVTHKMSKTMRVWAGYSQAKLDGIPGASPKFTNFTVGARKDF